MIPLLFHETEAEPRLSVITMISSKCNGTQLISPERQHLRSRSDDADDWLGLRPLCGRQPGKKP